MEYGKVIMHSSRFSTFMDFRSHVYKTSQLNKQSETARRVVYNRKDTGIENDFEQSAFSD